MSNRTSSSAIISENENDKFGLHIFSNPAERNVDFVAIHGFNGHFERSWMTEDNISWLRDVLPEDFPAARVMSFAFPSSLAGRNVYIQSSYELARNLLESVCHRRQKAPTPIVFFAYNLGGLILDQAMIISRDSTNSEIRQVSLDTLQIVYFDTPHRGVQPRSKPDLAIRFPIGGVFATINKAFYELLKDGVDDNELIALLELLNNRAIRVCSCYSSRRASRPSGLGLSDFGQESAVLGLGDKLESQLMIARAGGPITKFRSSGDLDYQFIVGKVKQALADHELNMHDTANLPISSLGRPFANVAELPDNRIDYNRIDDPGLDSLQSSQQVDPESLRLHSCSQNWQEFGQIAPKVDIVAVHSIGGHWKSSWQGPNGYSWLERLEEAIPEVRVFSNGWNSMLPGNFRFDLRDVATELLCRLEGVRYLESAKTRPLILIGHGVGGLIIKQAFVQAKDDARYQPIFNSTIALIFLATPHRGLDLLRYNADLAAEGIHHNTNHRLLPLLDHKSPTMHDLTTRFRLCHQHIKLLNFYELEAPRGATELVVPRVDALFEIPDECQVPVNADHFNISRFDSVKDQRGEIMWKKIEGLVQGSMG